MPRRSIPILLTLALVAGLPPTTAAEAPPPAEQIHAAVSPAPEALRAGARVLGYGADGALVELRPGTGELVCLADDPADDRFHVACYHAALEPFMARGRELRRQGVERDELVRIRGEEIAAGKLSFPSGPAALYSLTGPAGSFDADSQAVRGGSRAYAIYLAYATAESTGLPTSPITDTGPWLMAAGEPWAHVMVVQPTGDAPEAPEPAE